MKMNKLKILFIAICCLITTFFSLKTSCMEYYNRDVQSYRPAYNLNDQDFINDTNEIINNGNTIKVINLEGYGLITNKSVNHIISNENNFNQLTLLNLNGTGVDLSTSGIPLSTLKLFMPNADIKKTF